VLRLDDGYMRTRLLLVSVTQRLPELNAIPCGELRELDVGGLSAVLLVNAVPLGWPSSTVADAPLVVRLDDGYMRTRLLNLSATQRLPDESNARHDGELSVLAEMPPLFPVLLVNAVPLGWPSSTVADAPLVLRLDDGYFNILLLPESATQRLPDESNARHDGSSSVLAEIVGLFTVLLVNAVPLGWPSSTVADAPLVLRLDDGYMRTRLLSVSATQRLPDESNAKLFGEF
jgi:hypothetical protein